MPDTETRLGLRDPILRNFKFSDTLIKKLREFCVSSTNMWVRLLYETLTKFTRKLGLTPSKTRLFLKLLLLWGLSFLLKYFEVVIN